MIIPDKLSETIIMESEKSRNHTSKWEQAYEVLLMPNPMIGYHLMNISELDFLSLAQKKGIKSLYARKDIPEYYHSDYVARYMREFLIVFEEVRLERLERMMSMTLSERASEDNDSKASANLHITDLHITEFKNYMRRTWALYNAFCFIF